MIGDVAALVESYLAAWNAPDPAARLEELQRVAAPLIRYSDPDDHVDTLESLAELIARVTAGLPSGCRFERDGEVLSHHDAVLFRWCLRGPDDSSLATGSDVAFVEARRIVRLVGFFDAAVAVEEPRPPHAQPIEMSVRGTATGDQRLPAAAALMGVRKRILVR